MAAVGPDAHDCPVTACAGCCEPWDTDDPDVEVVFVVVPAVADDVADPPELPVPVAAELDPDPEVPDVPEDAPELPADVLDDVVAAEWAGSSLATTPTNTPVPITADAITQRLVRRTRSTASSRSFVWYLRGDAIGGTPLLTIRSLPDRLRILPMDPKNR